jgi:hypothetical protein
VVVAFTGSIDLLSVPQIQLRLVEQLARAWGVNRHPDGGKVVWCVLSL